MKKFIFIGLIAGTGLFLSNCNLADLTNAKIGGGNAGSCSLPSNGVCMNYVGSYWTSSLASSDCTSAGGAFSSSACASTDASGTCVSSCVRNSGATSETKYVFYPAYRTIYGATYDVIKCSSLAGGYSTVCP